MGKEVGEVINKEETTQVAMQVTGEVLLHLKDPRECEWQLSANRGQTIGIGFYRDHHHNCYLGYDADQEINVMIMNMNLMLVVKLF